MNKKIYKGYELIEAIANKKIKDYTRIIPHYPNNDCTVEYFEYSNGFIHDDKHSNDVNVCIFLNNDRTFEILEDNTEDKGYELLKTIKNENDFEQLGYEVGKLYLDFAKGIEKAVNELNNKTKDI